MKKSVLQTLFDASFSLLAIANAINDKNIAESVARINSISTVVNDCTRLYLLDNSLNIPQPESTVVILPQTSKPNKKTQTAAGKLLEERRQALALKTKKASTNTEKTEKHAKSTLNLTPRQRAKPSTRIVKYEWAKYFDNHVLQSMRELYLRPPGSYVDFKIHNYAPDATHKDLRLLQSALNNLASSLFPNFDRTLWMGTTATHKDIAGKMTVRVFRKERISQ